MTCEQFKNHIVDLFDVDVDVAFKAECEAHIASCDSCRLEYESLKHTFSLLQPQYKPGVSAGRHCPAKTVALRRLLTNVAAAVVVFLAGVGVGLSHFFSAPAEAVPSLQFTLDRAAESVRNVGNFSFELYARTFPQDNFFILRPEADFVCISLQCISQSGKRFWRIGKKDGRCIVFDGTCQYQWIPGVRYLKLPATANTLGDFSVFLDPCRFLDMQMEAVKGDAARASLTETDTTYTITTVGRRSENNPMPLLNNRPVKTDRYELENVFSKSDGLLRQVRMWIEAGGKKTLVLKSGQMSYNVNIDKTLLCRLPDTGEFVWRSSDGVAGLGTDPRAFLQKETATDAARRVMNALIEGKPEKVVETLDADKPEMEELAKRFKGCKVSGFSEPRKQDDYAGVYVFFRIVFPDGAKRTSYLALRSDNSQRIWVVDGGL